MNESRAYDPLTVDELGRNAARALMEYPSVALPPATFVGAGVYSIHYRGDFVPYTDLGETPIYVGQARQVHNRLREHARSIEQARNLKLGDFECRWLVLAPVWMSLTEDILIAQYNPIWNAIRGFGNHDQGRTRWAQQRSQWDTLHPGRPWASQMQDLVGGDTAVLKSTQQHKDRH